MSPSGQSSKRGSDGRSASVDPQSKRTRVGGPKGAASEPVTRGIAPGAFQNPFAGLPFASQGTPRPSAQLQTPPLSGSQVFPFALDPLLEGVGFPPTMDLNSILSGSAGASRTSTPMPPPSLNPTPAESGPASTRGNDHPPPRARASTVTAGTSNTSWKSLSSSLQKLEERMGVVESAAIRRADVVDCLSADVDDMKAHISKLETQDESNGPTNQKLKELETQIVNVASFAAKIWDQVQANQGAGAGAAPPPPQPQLPAVMTDTEREAIKGRDGMISVCQVYHKSWTTVLTLQQS